MVNLEKPSWVSHSGKAILSVDVHPDGKRFATAGEDHLVKLWSLLPVLSEDLERDEHVPRLLATLQAHEGDVNCARWSPCGTFLASGSADQMLMLWQQAASDAFGTAMPFGSDQPANLEKWRCAQTLLGHTSDVIDVAWSPDSRSVASVSVDNSVRIWQLSGAAGAAGGPQAVQHRVLQGHCSWVKGVAWDPIGRYVASHGDDKSVAVWKVRDWSEAARVTTPFERSSNKTLFRRLCWSPDGQFLCCPHAYKSPANIAVVLRRPRDENAWEQECDLVGHNAPVVCCAFSPATYSSLPAKDKERSAKSYFCCALGGQDCHVSIWLTSKAKSLIVVRDFFKNDVLDLAWCPDGYHLLACSLDGTLGCISLSASELGEQLSASEESARRRSLYGDTALSAHSHAAGLLESPAMLRLEAQAATSASEQNKTAAVAAHAPPSSASIRAAPTELTASVVASLQKETKTKDGKRRISPVALHTPLSSTLPPPPAAAPPSAPAADAPSTSAPSPTSRLSPRAAAPSAIPPAAAAPPAAPPAAAPKRAKLASTKQTCLPFAPAEPPPPPASRPSAAAAPHSAFAPAPPKDATAVRLLSAAPFSSSDELAGHANDCRAPLVLEAIPHRPAAVGPGGGGAHAGCTLRCSRGGELVWSSALTSAVVLLAGNEAFSAAGCHDGTLHVFTPAGRRAIPALRLSGSLSALHADAEQSLLWYAALPIGSDGEVRVWVDLPHRPKCKLQCNAAALSALGERLLHASLLPGGTPLLTLTSGVYCYQQELAAWACLSDASFKGSDYHTTLPVPPRAFPNRALASIQQAHGAARTEHPGETALDLASLPPERQYLLTRGHLEHQMASAIVVGSAAEYGDWTRLYAAALARHAAEHQVRELCDELLGPLPGAMDRAGEVEVEWEPEVMPGVSKRKLLREVVLPTLSTNRALQRLISEYVEMLSSLE
ncbi:hypothetical protein AB1Y20_012791 [Prymnesium parvum]|uniref:Protein HIRA n=1 Tax=Prymnesium parvum TaxID=97485 RepID=A0AB34IJM0_PRYPA